MKKEPKLIKNHAGGLDLLIEKDAGNEVLILTGKKKCSVEFWKNINQISEYALQLLEDDN